MKQATDDPGLVGKGRKSANFLLPPSFRKLRLLLRQILLADYRHFRTRRQDFNGKDAWPNASQFYRLMHNHANSFGPLNSSNLEAKDVLHEY